MRNFVFGLIMLASVPAFAGPATDAVKSANTAIATQVQTKAPAAQVTASVNNFLDIDELGKRALGDHWGKLTAAEQKQFLQELHALIEANYINLGLTTTSATRSPTTASPRTVPETWWSPRQSTRRTRAGRRT